jgi:hypothetical protein
MVTSSVCRKCRRQAAQHEQICISLCRKCRLEAAQHEQICISLCRKCRLEAAQHAQTCFSAVAGCFQACTWVSRNVQVPVRFYSYKYPFYSSSSTVARAVLTEVQLLMNV